MIYRQSGNLTLRKATTSDVPNILGFIRELARFEKLEHEVTGNESDLSETLFGAVPYAQVVMAEWEQKPVGFALYFFNYSTFLARPGLYLEDLFVIPQYRSRGVGTALLVVLAQIALGKNCGRMEWSVLDWNTRAIELYRRMGAVPQSDWTVQRLTGPALENLAKKFEEI